MDHHSVFCAAACCVDIPFLRCSSNQHRTRCCPSLTELVKRRPCAGAATGHLHFEYRMVIDGINRRWLKAHFGPISIEFIREDHRQRGKDSLTHLRVVHDHCDRIVGADTHKRIGRKCRRLRLWLHARQIKADQQSPACRHTQLQEIAARHFAGKTRLARFGERIHRPPPLAIISAARWTARRIRGYVPQRQILPVSASSMSSSVGLGISLRSTAALIICPDWQYPHCGTSISIQARCNGWLRSGESPSIVVISFPAARVTGATHERTAWPSIWTVHAPHCAMPQPYLVPVNS